jgi:hypothetical protein
MKQFLAIFTAALFLLSCQNQADSSWQTLTFKADKALLTHVNLGDTAHNHGDVSAWESPLRDTVGNIVGEAYGFLITVDIMDGDSANPTYIRERIGTSVFNFGDENEIVADGMASFHVGQKRLKIGKTQIFPIVGGTGKYKGIEGEFSATGQADSTNVYVFNFKKGD